MDKATVTRLRLYALLYRIEDGLREIERRRLLDRLAAQVRSYSAVLAGLPSAYAEELARIEERQYLKRRQLLEEANAIINSGLSVVLVSRDDFSAKALIQDLAELRPPHVGSYAYTFPPIEAEASFEKPRFTGYCNNRSKYGPRNPKRR